MSHRKVNFVNQAPASGSSPRIPTASVVTTGSGSDYSASSHLSDRKSYGNRGTATSQWNDLGALQEAYRALSDRKDEWEARFLQMQDDARESQKELAEAQAKCRALVAHAEEIKEENKEHVKEKKGLTEHVDELTEEVKNLKRQLREAKALCKELMGDDTTPKITTKHASSDDEVTNKKASTAPPSSTRSGTGSSTARSGSTSSSGSSSHTTSSTSSNHAKVSASHSASNSTTSSTSTAKLSRTASKRDSIHEQNKRLSLRFEAGSNTASGDSTVSSSSGGSSTSQKRRSHHGSHHGSAGGSEGSSKSGHRLSVTEPYVEPFGPGAPPARIPVSPTKTSHRAIQIAPTSSKGSHSPHYSTYAPQQNFTPEYMTPRGEGDVPRSSHPSVYVRDNATSEVSYQDGSQYYSYQESGYRSRHPR